MKKFFCYGKKDFCDNDGRCNGCGFIDNSGGEYREFLITNADRIRTMTDEELCKFIEPIPDFPCDLVGYPDKCMDDCKVCILKWLQQPAEEDGHD